MGKSQRAACSGYAAVLADDFSGARGRRAPNHALHPQRLPARGRTPTLRRCSAPWHGAHRSAAAQPLRLGRGPLPVIRNIHVLCDADAFLCQCPDQRALLLDSSAPTILEQSEGNGGVAARGFGHISLDVPLLQLTAEYNEHVWPSRARTKTRYQDWANWSLVITWATVRRVILHRQPITADPTKALSWDLIWFAASPSQITAVWSAVQRVCAGSAPHTRTSAADRGPQRRLRAWVKSILTIMGRSLSLKLPIHCAVIAKLLRWAVIAKLQQWRSCGCRRGSACLDATATGSTTASAKVTFPILVAQTTQRLTLCSSYRNGSWMQWMGLAVDPTCQKGHWWRPAAECPCPPLFSKTSKYPGVIRAPPSTRARVKWTLPPSATRLLQSAATRHALQVYRVAKEESNVHPRFRKDIIICLFAKDIVLHCIVTDYLDKHCLNCTPAAVLTAIREG